MKCGINFFIFLLFLFNCKVQSKVENAFDVNSSAGQFLILASNLPSSETLTFKTKYSDSDYPSFVKTGILEIDLSLPVSQEFNSSHIEISENYKNDLVVRDVLSISDTKIRILFVSSIRTNWTDDLEIKIRNPKLEQEFTVTESVLKFTFPKNRTAGFISEEKSSISSIGVSDSEVLLVGGVNPSGNTLATIEIFNFETGLSNVLNPLPTGMTGVKLCSLGEGIVYAIGGKTVSSEVSDISQLSNKIFRINTRTGSVSELGVTLNERRVGHTALCLPENKILISGGQISSGNVNSSLSTTHELVDLNQLTSQTLPNSSFLSQPMIGHAAVYNPNNGSVYFFGGRAIPENDYATIYDSVEKLNLNSNIIESSVLKLANGKSDPSVFLYGEGDFINLSGKIVTGLGSRSIDIWNESNSKAETIAFLEKGKKDTSVAEFSKGQITISGGLENYYKTANLELYDYSEKKVFSTGSMLFQRSSHSSVKVKGGILIFGDPTFAGREVEYYGKN